MEAGEEKAEDVVYIYVLGSDNLPRTVFTKQWDINKLKLDSDFSRVKSLLLL